MNQVEAEQMLAQLQHGRSKSAIRGSTQLEDLDLRLEQAFMWCKRHSDLSNIRNCLRPARLGPHPLAKDRWRAVDQVVSARRSELHRTVDVTLDDSSGQLLVYFPDADLADGAAEVASKDFFDVHNAPPCGTWIGYFEEDGSDPSYSSYLLAWIPPLFVEFANEGIKANPEECIKWLRDADVALRHITDHSRFCRIFMKPPK